MWMDPPLCLDHVFPWKQYCASCKTVSYHANTFYSQHTFLCSGATCPVGLWNWHNLPIKSGVEVLSHNQACYTHCSERDVSEDSSQPNGPYLSSLNTIWLWLLYLHKNVTSFLIISLCKGPIGGWTVRYRGAFILNRTNTLFMHQNLMTMNHEFTHTNSSLIFKNLLTQMYKCICYRPTYNRWPVSKPASPF